MAEMTLEEAFAAATVDVPSGMVDDIFVIDAPKRKIIVPDSESVFGVETDMDVERKYFRCPRIVGDNIDLYAHKIYVVYVTAKDVNGTFLPEIVNNKYWCDDVAVDGDCITFSWKLSDNVMYRAGIIAFKILAVTTDNGIEKTRWNTAPAYGTVLMTVPDGYDIEERYPDVITQILEKLEAIEEAGGSGYTLPVATNNKLGGVKPVAKTDEMTQEVGVDADGRMYTIPGGSNVAEWAQQPEKPTYTAEEVGAVGKEELPTAINTALQAAKDSGLFDGADGQDGYTPQKGVDYFDGVDGQNGTDGVSCTHEWNGTVLTITSASGTTSADLKGEKGDTGEKGEPGEPGASGVDGKNGADGITPHIGSNGNWWIGDTDTGISASGTGSGSGGGITEETDPTVPDWAKQPQKPSYTADEVGALPNTTKIPAKTSDLQNDSGFLTQHQDISGYALKSEIPKSPSDIGAEAAGTADGKVSSHNTAGDAHNDIRLLVQGLTERLNALADSDDTTLDQLSEIVAYIKSNKNLIDAITTNKVSVSDIVDNLTTNVSNRPLSAAQGVALKSMIEEIAESGSIVVTPEQYGAVGDCVTDDTDAINNAIQAVSSNGGGIVLMRKEYLVTSTITLALNVILEGVSKFASIIMKAQECAAVYVPGLNKHTGIKNLSIRGNFDVTSHTGMKRTYIGLQIGKPDADKSKDENALYYSIFDNVFIYGFGTGIDVNLYSWTLFCKNFRIEKCFYGMWNYSTDNSFEDFVITGCYGDGLHVQYSGNCKYRNFFVERNGQQKQVLGGSGEDVTTYYGINYRGGNNDIFSGITLIENHGHGFFCQYARNCYLDGVFAEMNGYYKYLNSGTTFKTKGIEFKLCKGVFGSIFGRNHDSNNPSQDMTFSTESCENMSIFYTEQNVPKTSTYSGTNVRFLSNADIANLGTGGGEGTGSDYVLPVATASTLGGVKPVEKTSAMTQSVGVDSEGRLYAAPTVSESETSWYSGKKIVCYGTSITEQGQSISKWMSNIAKVLGCSMDNQGHGGYRVVNYMEGDLSTMPMLQALPTDGSVYLFEGGINDWRNPSIKVDTGTSSYMPFKDALQRIATYMLTNMPKALHLWFTPHYCLTMVDGSATDTVDGETLEDYANAMIEVAEKNGIPCVDMYHLCGWRTANISTFVNEESGAYIHPNADGGVRISALILDALKRIEPTSDYTVNGGTSGGGESGGGTGTSEGLPADVLFAPTRIGITQNGTFTNYTELSSGEIEKISDTNYKLNITGKSGKYLAIETGNTTDNLRLAVKKISGTVNATLYHGTSLTSTNGPINTLADRNGDIQTPLASNNGKGYIMVSVTQNINAEIYVYTGNAYGGTSTTDEEKKQIENTFTT